MNTYNNNKDKNNNSKNKIKKIIYKFLASIFATLIVYAAIALLIIKSFPIEVALKNLEDNNLFELLLITGPILCAIIIMILLISIDLHILPQKKLSLFKVTGIIVFFIGSIVWLDQQIISPEARALDSLIKIMIINSSEIIDSSVIIKSPQTQISEMFLKFLSKFIELIVVASAVSFLISYRSEQSESPKDNVPNQNIDTKQTADSEKSESKNEQANNPTENNQTDTTKSEPEQSSEEKESPHG